MVRLVKGLGFLRRAALGAAGLVTAAFPLDGSYYLG
jgi:hypothetical protein